MLGTYVSLTVSIERTDEDRVNVTVDVAIATDCGVVVAPLTNTAKLVVGGSALLSVFEKTAESVLPFMAAEERAGAVRSTEIWNVVVAVL